MKIEALQPRHITLGLGEFVDVLKEHAHNLGTSRVATETVNALSQSQRQSLAARNRQSPLIILKSNIFTPLAPPRLPRQRDLDDFIQEDVDDVKVDILAVWGIAMVSGVSDTNQLNPAHIRGLGAVNMTYLREITSDIVASYGIDLITVEPIELDKVYSSMERPMQLTADN